jgi:diacylglycerol kinase (ATP)
MREPPTSLYIIANPTAGKGSAARHFARAQARLESAGIVTVVVETQHFGHGTTLARRAAEEGRPIVVALGGDGTIRDVAAGLADTQTVMGILPLGTGNDLARSLGIPFVLEDAADILAKGVVRVIDLGEETSGIFTVVAGTGFAAEVSDEAARTRLFRGSAAYYTGVFKALMRLRPVPTRLTFDDQTVETETVFVMAQNAPYCGGGQLMAPGASLDDGTLDIVVVSAVGRLDLIQTFPKVYDGKHITHPAFHLYRSTSVEVESARPVLKMNDGDVIGKEPLKAWVRPRALRVLVHPSASGSSSSEVMS